MVGAAFGAFARMGVTTGKMDFETDQRCSSSDVEGASLPTRSSCANDEDDEDDEDGSSPDS